MIFKRRHSAALLVLLCGAFVASGSDDFKFDSDDLQIVYTDAEAATKPPSRYFYAKEIAQCPTGEGKMMLTLLLQSLRWSSIGDRKKEKAIKKLSRFFSVPRQFITVSDIHTPEILEMLKHSINKSNILLNTKDSMARVEFMIGCGDKMFANGKTIAHQINDSVKSGDLEELSGLPISWWNIWLKYVKSRAQRTRRQADGSGNDEDVYYDEDEDLTEEDDDEIATNEESTEAPRVRHNQRKKNSQKKKMKKILVTTHAQDEPSAKTEEKIKRPVEDVSEIPVEIPITEVEPVTQRNSVAEGPITPIDVIENIKLESYVNKTIVNDNNVVDVPVYQTKDEMLEEVKKMISEPPTDLTTVVLTTTTESSTTQQILEIEKTNDAQTTSPEEVTKSSSILVVGTTLQTDAETIFVPIIINNNENINSYDEKVSVIGTAESPPLKDEITERVTTHIHETTLIPITTISPPSTTTILEITTLNEQSTTTLKIVDATLALDKVIAANEVDEKPKSRSEKKKHDEESESNYDDEYDDTLPEEDVGSTDVEATSSPPQLQTTAPRRTALEITTLPTTEHETSPSTQAPSTTQINIATDAPNLPLTSEPPSESIDYEDANVAPRVDKRIPKRAVTAGKPFVITVDENVFYDEEDKTKLSLQLLDKNELPISHTSWIRFDPSKREIYGLPLEGDVSRYEFKLRATDSAGESVDENVDITVQQYKGFRSANHEIFIQVKLEKNYESPVDWEIRLVRGIVEALGDGSTETVVVREVRPNKYEPNMFTFVYTNETLPKDHCPKDELDQLMTKLTKPALNEAMKREIVVRNIEKELVGSCQEKVPAKIPVVPTNTKNFPPTVRNPVDRITANVGQLLVFEVPKDTFYDPEDLTDLKLTLLNDDRTKIEPNHWLQFDAKNREFFGVPSLHDKGQQYILVAEDKNGLTTNDALIVEVNNGYYKKDLSATFEYQLDIGNDQFQNALTKRKFIEGVARVFQDTDTSNILLKMFKKLQYVGRTAVVLQNTTLARVNRDCPSTEIEKLRKVLILQDGSVRDEVKKTIGNDFNVLKITVAPTGKCAGGDSFTHPEEITPRPEDQETPVITQDVLVTYVLPTAIILLMLLIALLIACVFYKRRNTGKMELGDEEERKSFRSRGIPVIFQDELEEKPEILTKSPVIMKDEKPPLLPQYNGLNQDGDDDNMDQYIPPQPLLMGNRESRGKSPVTPSYRKPPPYVSP